MNRPVVIGGGVAGLTAAVKLAQRGLRPLLLEADPEWVGGRLKDGPPVEFESNGRRWSFPSEHGVHGLWSPYVNLKALLAELDIAPNYVPAQDETWILGDGSWVRKAKIGRTIRKSKIPAPLHYLQLFLKPSMWRMMNIHDWASLPRVAGGLFAAMSIDPLAEQNALKGLSLADMTAGWSPNMRAMFAGLARNALAAEAEEIPAAGWIAFLRFYTLMRRDAWGFDYLPTGGGTAVCEPLAQKVIELGGEIMMGASVEQLIRGVDGGWQVTMRRAGQIETVAAAQVVMALDAPSAQTLLLNSLDTAETAAALYFPQGIPTAIIRIWFDGKPQRVSEAGMISGDFIIDNFFWLEQLQEVYRPWGEAGGSVIETHIYGPPELLDQSDAMLLTQVARDVHRAFPELRGRRQHIILQRNEATHTLFSVGDAGENLTVKTPWPDLYACGDWVYHENPALYLERAVTTSLAAVNALLTDQNLEPHEIFQHPQPELWAQYMSHWWQGVRVRLLRRARRKKVF
ncbi:MAG: FAD-dependent oxidoreductase [Anaerolineales bacterium]|nr:FAD-dependent oxidoreductase [Anaerolineales bacterium]